MIRVLVADDHSVVRQGICHLLAETEGIEVVGEAADGEEAIAYVGEIQPDVLILDISMPRVDGMEALRRLKHTNPAPKIVMLSMHGDVQLVEQALQDGAQGFVLKQAVRDELIAAVQAASRGSLYLSSDVSHIFASQLAGQKPKNPVERLSPREREVVKLTIEGNSAKQIALLFKTSVKTVEKQRLDAMRKLEVDNVAALIRVGLDIGLGPKKDSHL